MASQQDIYYTLSTWNPYVADVMKSTISNNDPDGDGVPTKDPHDGVTDVDNCPLAYNPDQANCNSEAEQAWNANHPSATVPLLGDACDPVPCPRADADGVTSSTSACTPGDRYVTRICYGREVHDEIDLTTVGSSALQDPGGVARETPPVHDVVSPTHGRFCQTIPTNFLERQTGVNCVDADILRDSQLDGVVASAEMETLDAAHPWHRITLVQGTSVSDRDEALVFSFDYGGAPASMRWDYANDNAFWHRTVNGTAVNIIGDPGVLDPECSNTATYGQGTCLVGRLWLHGDTNVGTAANPNAPDGTVVGVHGTELTNYYFDSQPDKTVVSIIPGLGDPVHGLPRILYRWLIDPPIGELVGPNWATFDRGLAVPIFIDGERILGLRQNSALVDASSSFGPSFARELLAGTSWVDAPGPSTVGITQPMAIAMSDNGTAVLGTANVSGGSVLLGREADLNAQLSSNVHASDGTENFGATVNVSVPSEVEVTAGNAGNGQLTITFLTDAAPSTAAAASADVAAHDTEDPRWNHFQHQRHESSIQCLYTGGASQSHPTTAADRAAGLRYLFTSCSNGANAGDVLAVSSATMHVVSGDSLTVSTKAEVGIAATEVASSPLYLGQSSSCPSGSPSPRPRKGFVSTYAPTLNGVFVVGGESLWREPLSDVWFKPLVGAWQQVQVPEGTIGRVIDAAFSPADGRLWVIDEAPSTALPVGHWSCHGQPTIRLLRIERETGALRVVASATPHGLYDMRGLRVDRDGQILIYASSHASNAHRVVRLVPDSNDFDAFATARAPQALTSPLVVDYRGYSFVEESPPNSPKNGAPTIERVASLPFSPATLDAWSTLLQ